MPKTPRNEPIENGKRQEEKHVPSPIPHRGRGRPTEYDPAFCEIAIQAGAEGDGLAGIAAKIGIVRSTLNEWVDRYPDFSAAIAHARELSLSWWEQQGKDGIWAGKQFNAQAYSLQVRNRFPEDWRERTEQVIDNKQDNRNGQELIASVAALVSELLPHLQSGAGEPGKVIDITPKIEASDEG